MFTLLKKELQYYLNNPLGYIILVVFGISTNFLFMKDVFIIGSVSFPSFFSIFPWIMMIFLPAIGMRSLSEEKRINTIELLLTLPISETKIVLAKFFSLLLLVSVGLLLTISVPVVFSPYVRVYVPEILVGYFGCLLFAAVGIAVTMFYSSLTKSQILSFLFSLITLFLLLGISSEILSSFLPKEIQDMLVYFSPIYHFQNFLRSIIDLRSVYYFLSITVVFLLLTILQFKKKS